MNTYGKIELLEREFADPESRKDVTRLSDLLSDEFEEFNSSGEIIRKPDVLRWLAIADPVRYSYSNFSFRELSETCILVKYISNISGKRAFRSSIWIQEDSGWKMLHHQATAITA